MQNKRRQYMTHKGYQMGILLEIILICAIGLFINLGIFNFFSYKEIESLRWRMHIPVDKSAILLDNISHIQLFHL